MLRVNEDINQTNSDSLQEDNQTISDFVKRTDELSIRKGLNMSEIHGLLDISKAMVFAYRSGKNRITPKVWLKLQLAEQEAGIIGVPSAQNAGSSTYPKELDEAKIENVVPDDASRQYQTFPRMIPVVGWAHAGEAESYEQLPNSWQHKIPTECRDVKAFAVELEGDSMEPKYSEGDMLIVQPSETAHSGSLVVARFANDGVVFRRLEVDGKTITLVPLNPRYRTSQYTPEDFSWIYPVWGRWTQIWRR